MQLKNNFQAEFSKYKSEVYFNFKIHYDEVMLISFISIETNLDGGQIAKTSACQQ